MGIKFLAKCIVVVQRICKLRFRADVNWFPLMPVMIYFSIDYHCTEILIFLCHFPSRPFQKTNLGIDVPLTRNAFLLQRACRRCPTPADYLCRNGWRPSRAATGRYTPNYPEPKDEPETLSTALYVARVEAGSANVGIMLCFLHFFPCSAAWRTLSGPSEMLM